MFFVAKSVSASFSPRISFSFIHSSPSINDLTMNDINEIMKSSQRMHHLKQLLEEVGCLSLPSS